MQAEIIDLADAKQERRLRERQARVMARVVDEVMAVVGPVSGADDIAAFTSLVAEQLATHPDFAGEIIVDAEAI